jgi:hypothetical protein
MVTTVPTSPDDGPRLVIVGVGRTVNVMPLLATTSTVTTRGPVVAPVGTGTLIEVAFQLEGVAGVPLKVTVLVPWVDPKFAPEIVIVIPTPAEVGEIDVILGADVTVNLTPLLSMPSAVTTTDPVVAPVGTVATICVAVQFRATAAAPLNVTVLLPWVAPKLVPSMLTIPPTGPDVGERLEMIGAAVKRTPLLATPTVTSTSPDVTPLGVVATICVADQLLATAATPLNVTVLDPCEAPNPSPVIVTVIPALPEIGERLVIVGAEVSVKVMELLLSLSTVTTTGPVVAPLGTGTTIDVALQLVGAANIALKVTVLVPFVDPKFVPVIVTAVPAPPEVGDKLVMVGTTAV